MKYIKILRNQRGVLTMDVVFAFALVAGTMLITLALALTLTAIEVAQYIAFSTSRAYYSANATPQAQEAQAQAKYDELIAKKPFQALFQSRWFELKFSGAGDFRGSFDSAIAGKTYNPLWGTEVQISVKILGFNVPFFGKTSTSDQGLKTAVNSFLGREPSTEECLRFNAERWKKLKDLVGTGANPLPDTGYFIIADNGC